MLLPKNGIEEEEEDVVEVAPPPLLVIFCRICFMYEWMHLGLAGDSEFEELCGVGPHSVELAHRRVQPLLLTYGATPSSSHSHFHSASLLHRCCVH